MNGLVYQLKRLWGGVKDLSHDSNRSSIGLFADFVYCYARYGCLPRHYLYGGFWNKSENDRKDILTYRRFVRIMNQLNRSEDIHILENKAHFNKFYSDFVHRDWLLSSESSSSQVAEFIRRHGKVIIKPFDAMEGHGIYKLEASKTSDLDATADKLANSKMMIEEILVQHPAMVFGNTSVNTIRVHTILDRNGKGHVLSCVLRAGVGESVVDNYCSGGVIYPVDVNYGIVTGAGKSRTGDRHIVHPLTTMIMLGYKIPNWNILKSGIIEAAERLPGLRLVGWDVAITDSGIALIEGNHNPDYEFYEFIGDGKSYKQIKQFI